VALLFQRREAEAILVSDAVIVLVPNRLGLRRRLRVDGSPDIWLKFVRYDSGGRKMYLVRTSSQAWSCAC